MHFLFSLLRIKGLYMFRALLAHPQEVLNKRHLVYCVRVMSVGCTRVEVYQFHFNPGAANWQIYIKFVRLCEYILFWVLSIVFLMLQDGLRPKYVTCVDSNNSNCCSWRHMCVMCYVSWLHQGRSGTPTLVQPIDITRTQYTKCRLFRASWGWASNARNM
jgi:hypothetical protein